MSCGDACNGDVELVITVLRFLNILFEAGMTVLPKAYFTILARQVVFPSSFCLQTAIPFAETEGDLKL